LLDSISQQEVPRYKVSPYTELEFWNSTKHIWCSYLKSFPTLEVHFLLLYKSYSFNIFERLYNYFAFLDGQIAPQLMLIINCRPLLDFASNLQITSSSMFLGLITKLQNVTISIAKSVCLSTQNSSLWMNFYFQVCLQTKITGTLYEDLHKFISDWILLCFRSFR
jgi:hypothetical protein